MVVADAARCSRTRGVELPDDVIELEQKAPIPLNGKAVGNDGENAGVGLEAAPCFVGASDQIDEKGRTQEEPFVAVSVRSAALMEMNVVRRVYA